MGCVVGPLNHMPMRCQKNSMKHQTYFHFFHNTQKCYRKKKKKRHGISKNIMHAHGRTLCWGRGGGGGGDFVFQKALPLVEEKFSLKRHLVNTNTPMKYPPMLYGYLFVIIDYFNYCRLGTLLSQIVCICHP
jgi:hypothetical protein